MSRTGQSRLTRAVKAGVTAGTLVFVIAAQAAAAQATSLGTPVGLPVVDSYAGGGGGGQFRAPVLSWNPVASASGYQVQVSSDSQFSETPTLDLATAATRLALPQELDHASYWWRVRAKSSSATGLWSGALGPFGRAWKDIPAGLLDNGGARLSWNAVPGASFYQVQFSTTAWRDDVAPMQTYKVKTTDCFTDHTTLTPFSQDRVVIAADETSAVAGDCMKAAQLSPATSYFWRVRAWDADAEASLSDISTRCLGAPYFEAAGGLDGNTHVPKKTGECSYWSSTATFTTPVAPTAGSPATPTLISPLGCPVVSGLPTCSDTPTLQWAADPHADFYVVMLSLDCDACNDSGMTNIIRGWVTPYASFTAPESLRDNDAQSGYHYYVQSCVGAWPAGPFSCTDPQTPPGHFRIQHPAGPAFAAGTPLGSHVVGGQQVVNSAQVTLQWTPPIYSVASYSVDVTDIADADFNAPRATLADVNAPEATFSGLADGSYRYRVRAKDSSGLIRTASIGSFLVDSSPPIASLPQAILPLAGPVQIFVNEVTTPVSGSTLGLAVRGSSTLLPGTLTATSISGLYNFAPASPLVAGLGYHAVVSPSVTDVNGNAAQSSPTIRLGNSYVDDRSAALQIIGGSWSTGSSAKAYGGTFVYSAGYHAALRTTVYGKQVLVYACKTPSSGMVDVAVSGQATVRVNLYQPYTSCGVLVYNGPVASVAQRTVTLINSGTKSAGSAGTYIAVDLVRVL